MGLLTEGNQNGKEMKTDWNSIYDSRGTDDTRGSSCICTTILEQNNDWLNFTDFMKVSEKENDLPKLII